MSKISFDSHLIEADTFCRARAPKWLLSACYGTGILFDGCLMAPTGAGRATHLSRGSGPTAPDLLTIRKGPTMPTRRGLTPLLLTRSASGVFGSVSSSWEPLGCYTLLQQGFLNAGKTWIPV
ncbi:MAG: hypothetical protein WAW52_12735 [Methanothrix sp.]